MVVACPDQGAGNDPEAFGLTLHQGPTFRGNDLPLPRRSVLSGCFDEFCFHH